MVLLLSGILPIPHHTFLTVLRCLVFYEGIPMGLQLDKSLSIEIRRSILQDKLFIQCLLPTLEQCCLFFIVQSLTSSFKASSACNVKCWVISLQAWFLSWSDTKLTLGADIFCFHSRALTGILSLTMNPHWFTYVWACGPNGLPVSVSNSDIMKRPSNGFFGPRTFCGRTS